MNRNDALMLLIEEAHRGEFHFPTSAKLAIKIRQTLDDPNCHLEAAGKLIQAEPLLAAQVIAIANSVAYNPGGREIADVRSATARLGFQTLRTLAMAFVTRQMAGAPSSPEQQRLATALWEHTAHVAALCQVIAAKSTKENPDAALFAGLVHEIGGFYLLSRSAQYPVLLSTDAEAPGDIDRRSVVNTLSLAVLRNLGVPALVLTAVEQYAEGFVATPIASIGDTLVAAEAVAPVPSPMHAADAQPNEATQALDQAALETILRESAAEVASLAAALCA